AAPSPAGRDHPRARCQLQAPRGCPRAASRTRSSGPGSCWAAAGRRTPAQTPAAATEEGVPPPGPAPTASARAYVHPSLRSWVLCEVPRAVDERDVRIRLREVPELPLAPTVILLREQAHIVAQGQQALEEPPRVLQPTLEDIVVH